MGFEPTTSSLGIHQSPILTPVQTTTNADGTSSYVTDVRLFADQLTSVSRLTLTQI
jgi:hypothetical protein